MKEAYQLNRAWIAAEIGFDVADGSYSDLDLRNREVSRTDMHAGTMNQASYGGVMNQAPAETTTQAPYQSQWQWKPIKPAL